MLSILIPTYNYNAYPLVLELHKQCMQCEILFEIIVIDDASNSELNIENIKIDFLSNCSFKILDTNIGRSSIRNLLAKLSKFENLLFLDSDTIPILNNFIQNYISQINDCETVVYGGIKYQTERPSKNQLLRWVYGNKREALSVEKRIKNPYLCFLTLNFLIKKSIFNQVKFNESIQNLRHEDTLFSFDLKNKNIKIIHIENPICHLGLETSSIFIKKSEESIIGLKHLIDLKNIDSSYTKISNIYKKIETYRLTKLISFTFNLTKPLLEKQLLSLKPSLCIFDLYRLGYLCSLRK